MHSLTLTLNISCAIRGVNEELEAVLLSQIFSKSGREKTERGVYMKKLFVKEETCLQW